MENVKEFVDSLPVFESHGSSFEVKYYDSKNIPKNVLNWAFHVLKVNMHTMYENCDWGWRPKQKMKELTAKKARFLVVSQISETGSKVPVAFVHFRFDMDYGRKVVYCYELQLEVGVRRFKLGSWLMKLLETFGSKSNHPRVVLTVLKANEGAIKFYRELGYEIDSTNPPKSEGRPYFIYSKVVNTEDGSS